MKVTHKPHLYLCRVAFLFVLPDSYKIAGQLKNDDDQVKGAAFFVFYAITTLKHVQKLIHHDDIHSAMEVMLLLLLCQAGHQSCFHLCSDGGSCQRIEELAAGTERSYASKEQAACSDFEGVYMHAV